jgi:hypothetical protein
MKKILVVSVFMLVTLVWVVAQHGSGGQGTSASSQAPNAGQQPPATSGGANQNAPQTGAQAGGPGQAVHPPVTEGCLGGSNPNFTITDKTGTTYKLNLPPNADASALTPHVGESVQVMGDVRQAGSANSIDVSRIGKGAGTCPGSSPSGQQPPPKQ